MIDTDTLRSTKSVSLYIYSFVVLFLLFLWIAMTSDPHATDASEVARYTRSYSLANSYNALEDQMPFPHAMKPDYRGFIYAK